MKHYIAIFALMFFIPSALVAGPLKGKLVIFHAGSLSIPFRDISEAFMKAHPGIKIVRESSGSRTAARKIRDLGRRCDIMASADSTVIDELLIPRYADFRINFATNEMAIMYTPKSRYASEITPDNWFRIILRDGVEYAHSDPNTDPCGYRTLMVWQLAEKYYKKIGLYKMLTEHCPEKNIRPKEVDLIALLEAGELDYVFIYRSVCKQHHMPFVRLPDMINLGNPRYNNLYKNAYVKVTGKRPGTFIIKRASAMTYALTIPKEAPNRKAAVEFIKFLLSNKGKEIIERDGQGFISPPVAAGYSNLPEELKPLCRPE